MELKPGYKQTEVGVIPEDWDVSKLGDCGTVVMGQSPSGASYNRAGFGSALINGPTEFTDKYPQKIQWTAEPTKFCKHGDLLICVRGSSTGRTNYANDIYCIGRGVAAIRALSNNDTGYLSFQVMSAVGYILAATTGSTFPSIDGKSLRAINIPLPPTKAEQEAIAEALSDADALIEALEQLIAKKRQVKQGAMQELLMGKRRLPGFSESGHKNSEIGEIPCKWRVVEIGKIASVKTGPFGSSLHEHDYVDNGTPIITVEHLGERGVVHANLPMVSNEDRKRLSVYSLEEGDIVFSRVGSVDRNARISNAERGWLFSGRLLRLRRLEDNVDTHYLSYQFHSEPFKQRVRTVAVGQTMASLNTQILKNVLIVLPCPSEQTAIAAILSDIDAEIVALEEKLVKARRIKQGMMQELLTGRIRLVQDHPTLTLPKQGGD